MAEEKKVQEQKPAKQVVPIWISILALCITAAIIAIIILNI